MKSSFMNMKSILATFACAWLLAGVSQAQTIVSEDFTGATTTNSWFFFNGACLTAGTSATTTSPGVVPACTTVLSTYYNISKDKDAAMVGGSKGYLGSTTAPSSISAQQADASGSGALRFTNGYPYGHNESGAIVSNYTFPTGQGVQIQFKTMTYLGDSGGSGGDGADGMSFYLMDGCAPLPGGTVPSGCATSAIYGTGQTFQAIGAFGGSLAYTCSNTNSPYDGLVGAYIGLGMDEYGNFLNGSSNTLGETGSSSTNGGTGDNTASGGLYKPGRIGLRGAGSISWQALNTAYGTSTGSAAPYYPSSLAAVCASGGTAIYSGGQWQCESCPNGGTYSSVTNTCSAYYCSSGTLSGTSCLSCSSGTLSGTSCVNICTSSVYVSSTGMCTTCSNGLSNLRSSQTSCKNSGSLQQSTPTSVSATSVAASNAPTSSSAPDMRTVAVQKTCSTGNLWNYSDPNNPVNVGTATLSNAANTAGILDYAAIGSTTSTGSQIGYSVLPTTAQIAAESATTRSSAVPIVYNLKITQDGLLSLSYSYNGGTLTPVIKAQNITSTNGPLPSSFRFGFAGSTGGSTNVHEILCFKASPAESTGSSGAVNVYENPTVKTGTQLYLAYYFPSDWTGSLTAQSVVFDTTANMLAIQATPNWDARCVLTGVNATTGKCSTGATALTAENWDTGRVMLTWNGTAGVAFRYANLSTTQQAAITAGDTTPSANRVNYLRGDRSNEITSAGVGLFRARDAVLGDIVDSSPSWVGAPNQPYNIVSSWVDQVYPSATQPENSGTQTYAQYITAKQGRTNVVYVGGNDGFLHGFRAGAQDSNGNSITSTTQPNDGQELLAYMPAAVVSSIHPVDSSGNVVATADYANTQYSHAYYVDATPATGDVFFNKTWHTWLVSGLGAGGAGIFALDITDPGTFTEANAASIVLGDWTPATITCVGNSTCGSNMGQTYGTPLIRRFHSGQWGAIFGNGLNSASGASGIFIMLIDPSSGAITWRYLSTGLANTAGNGIANASSADYDLDHTIDYIYAGDALGNVWKFDVTSQNSANWAVTASSPLFSAGSAQPITTRITVSTVKIVTTHVNAVGLSLDNGPERVILAFGTGQQIPQTPTSAAQYATGQQYMYGIWDWDQGTPATTGWNHLSPNQLAIGLTGAQSISAASNLVKQTLTRSGTTGTMSHNTVCFKGTCTGGTAMGWYLPLPGTNEQIIYDPVVSPVDGSLIVNTFIPASSSLLSCTPVTNTGFSIGLEAQTGAGLAVPLFNVGGTSYDSVERDATGTASVLNSGQAGDNNSSYLITHNSNGAQATQLNDTSVTTGQRLYWIQKR